MADVDERVGRHRGDDGGHPRLVPAEAGIDHGRAGGLDFGCQRNDVVPALAALDVVGHRHPVADDEVGSGRGAGAPHDLDGKSAALLGGSAPGVVAFVRSFRQELVEQISFAAHDFDAVVACLTGQLGAAGEVVDGALDTGRREPARTKRVDRRLDRRRADRKRMVGIASGVQDLQQDFAAGIVHRRRDAAMPACLRGRGQVRGEGQQPAGPVRRVSAGDDQAHATVRAFGEVCGEPVGVAGAILQAGVHRAHDHPVAQRGESEIQRGQQVWIGHRFSPKAAVTSSSQSMVPSSVRIPPRSTRYWCNALPRNVVGSGNCFFSNPR